MFTGQALKLLYNDTKANNPILTRAHDYRYFLRRLGQEGARIARIETATLTATMTLQTKYRFQQSAEKTKQEDICACKSGL